MSDYLLALARRSAGIAPAVHARVVPIGPVVAGPVAAPVRPTAVRRGVLPASPPPASGPSHDVIPAVTLRSEPGPRAESERPRSRPAEEVAPPSMSRPIDDIAHVTRDVALPAPPPAVVTTVGAGVAPPVEGAGRASLRPAAVAPHPVPPPASPARSARTDGAQVVPDERPASVLPRPEGPDRPRNAPDVLAPAATLRPAPPRGPDGPPAGPPAASSPRPTAGHDAAAIPAESRRSPRIEILEAQPERQIDVRIGTIEIHGPEPVASATVPATVPPAEPAPSVGGFDGFVRLRTYAPWGR